MSIELVGDSMDNTVTGNPRTNLIRAALLPALATALVCAPQILANIPAVSGIDSSSVAEPFIPVVPMVLLFFLGAPAVAFMVNWRWPAATNKDRATYAGLPQALVVPALAWLAVWIDVERGYLLKDSGEEAMAYGILITLGAVAGVVLTILVACAGRLGAWLGTVRAEQQGAPL